MRTTITPVALARRWTLTGFAAAHPAAPASGWHADSDRLLDHRQVSPLPVVLQQAV